MAFHKSSTKAVAWNHPQKGVNYYFFFAGIRQAIRRWKALDRKLRYAVSAGLAKIWKNFSSFKFLPENLEKFRSTNLYDAPLEGSTIFLYCSYLGHMSLKSWQLAEWKYAIFSRTGRKTKKLGHSNLFLSTVFKHGLLEGLTFLFQKICNFTRIGRNTEE